MVLSWPAGRSAAFLLPSAAVAPGMDSADFVDEATSLYVGNAPSSVETAYLTSGRRTATIYTGTPSIVVVERPSPKAARSGRARASSRRP